MATHVLKLLWVRRITHGPNPQVLIATEGGDTRWTASGGRAGTVALGLKPGSTIEVKTNSSGEVISLRKI